MFLLFVNVCVCYKRIGSVAFIHNNAQYLDSLNNSLFRSVIRTFSAFHMRGNGETLYSYCIRSFFTLFCCYFSIFSLFCSVRCVLYLSHSLRSIYIWYVLNADCSSLFPFVIIHCIATTITTNFNAIQHQRIVVYNSLFNKCERKKSK